MQEGSNDGFTSRLLRKLKTADWQSLDEITRTAARRHLLDTVAVIVAGSKEQTTQVAMEALAAVRPTGDLPTLLSARRFDVLDAAYVMAVAGHGLELDDGYRAGSAHPGVVTIPAALAMACMMRASGAQLLESVVAGYEAMTAISRAVHPMLRRRGFHPTAAVGVFAAAATAGHLLGLTDEQRRTALGLAASSASGLFAFVQGGADVKRLHPGHAAREGLFAALLARSGANAPPRAIEGPNGFFAAFADMPDTAEAPLDVRWGITDCYIKPWPCCRHLHPAIDAVLQIYREQDYSGADVEAVEVETYRIAADHASIPWTGFASAQLSFPYALSVALVHGDVRLEHFSEIGRSDAQVNAMTGRISIHGSDAMDERYRSERPSKVTILLRDGRRFQRDVRDALGAPSMPLDDMTLANRFVDLVGSATNVEKAAAMHAAWSRVEQVDDVTHLVGALSSV